MALEAFDQFLEQFPSEETRRAYRRDIIKFFNWAKKRPIKITKLDALGDLKHLRDSGISNSSINRSFSAIRSYMRLLVSVDVISKNPFDRDAIRMPKIQRVPKEGITNEEMKRILSASKNNLEKAIICLMAYNGLRRSEVSGLRQRDIYEINDIRVIEIHGKGDKTRIIPLHVKCYEYMSGLISQDLDRPIFLIRNKKITSDYIYKIIRRIVKDANIHKKIHPHMFRAKFASLALESGVPITSVQADMGHASIETTAMYDHAKNRLDRSSVNKIQEIR
jgi:site-specific recombinase XerD